MLSPEIVMQELSPLFPSIYSALDFGAGKAKEFFEKQETLEGKNIDLYLAPHLVRYYALNFLKRNGQDAREDNELSLDNIPFNGIHINHGCYQIKILKSNKGDLPVPGHSKTRREYYDQRFIDFGNGELQDVKLILLWNVDMFYGLGILSLAFPKSGGITRESVTAHWHCKIPEKMLYGKYMITDKITVEEILDLPIEKIDIDKTGTDFGE